MTSKQEPDYRSFRNKGQGGAPLDDEDKKRQEELNEWRAKRKLPWWMMQDESCDYQREYRLDIVNARQLNDTNKTWQRLGIDELGIEPIEVQNYGNITTPSSDVLSYRYDRRLPTFVTTNLAQRPEDGETLRQRYGDRLADRFNEMFFVIAFYNKSYR